MSAQKADKTAGGPVFLVCRREPDPCRGSKERKSGGVGAVRSGRGSGTGPVPDPPTEYHMAEGEFSRKGKRSVNFL